MWEHSGCKDQNQLLSVYDELGETGIEGNQRKRHCLERSPVDVDENVLVGLYLLGSDVDHYRMLWERLR